ncbi:CHRD domain-containing protein [Solitalea canadensis]|nr:CHRD domain-containing protein [Solitalea canadensis]
MKQTPNLITKASSALTLIVLAFFIGFSSCSSSNDDNPSPGNTKVLYSGTFAKSNNTVTTTATGAVSAELNTSNNELSYSISWNNLTSAVGDMHFHDNGPIIVHIEGFPTTVSGSFSGKTTLTAGQVTDLGGGKIYVQIHTVNFPGGEVIATLTKTGGSNPSPSPGY